MNFRHVGCRRQRKTQGSWSKVLPGPSGASFRSEKDEEAVSISMWSVLGFLSFRAGVGGRVGRVVVVLPVRMDDLEVLERAKGEEK